MAGSHPSRIPGRWREGFALDSHTVSSNYVGDDEYGHPMFDTKRSELGELLYRLKYSSDISVVDEIVDTAAEFLNSWRPDISLIVPGSII
jgi:competence protein ComFC